MTPRNRPAIQLSMKNQILSTIALTACLTTVKAQPANPPQVSTQPSQGAVEKRVEKLESDIGQILQILKTQQQSPAAPATANPPSQASSTDPASPDAAATTSGQSAAATPAPQAAKAQQTANLKPGAILELWVLKPDFTGDAPLGRSIGALVDEGEYFRMANFLEEPSLSGQQSNRVAVKWNGLFKAKETGAHVFTLELSKPTDANDNKGSLLYGSFDSVSWVVDFSISDQSIIKHITEKSSANREIQASESAEVNMEPGYFPLSIMTFFNVERGEVMKWNYAKPKITLKVRGPSDMKPRIVTSSDLFHKE